MDWSKASNILIALFLVLDLVLGVYYFGQQMSLRQADMAAAEDTAEKVYDDTSKKVKQGRDRVREQLRERRAEKKLEKAEQNKLSEGEKSSDYMTMRRYGNTESFDNAHIR